MTNDAVSRTEIVRVSNGASAVAEDMLAVEEPLEIQLRYRNEEGVDTVRSVSVTMRTPGNDDLLGPGFLFTEGILQRKEQIEDISFPEQNKVLVRLAEGVQPQLKNAERNFYTTSSCGVCGKSSIEAIRTVSVFEQPATTMQVSSALLYRLPQQLRAQQEAFESTGGLHASALFDRDGNFLTLQEDVGRHNALDKVIGHALMQGLLPLNQVMLLLSGRASFELVQKAVMAGISFVAAIGAPSSLAVSLAEENGLTLVGFLRGDRFNIYTGAHNITPRKEQL